MHDTQLINTSTALSQIILHFTQFINNKMSQAKCNLLLLYAYGVVFLVTRSGKLSWKEHCADLMNVK